MITEFAFDRSHNVTDLGVFDGAAELGHIIADVGFAELAAAGGTAGVGGDGAGQRGERLAVAQRGYSCQGFVFFIDKDVTDIGVEQAGVIGDERVC